MNIFDYQSTVTNGNLQTRAHITIDEEKVITCHLTSAGPNPNNNQDVTFNVESTLVPVLEAIEFEFTTQLVNICQKYSKLT